jgi:AraC-like DNA-binding protein
MISKSAAMAEQGAWRDVQEGWRPLYGDFDRLGVSVEWHDFRIERSLDWGRSFHPRSLEFCLNLAGRGAVGTRGQDRSDYLPGNSGYYAIADEPLPASRQAHDHHQFATLEFSRDHLQKQFVQNEADLEPEIRRVVFGDKDESVIAPVRPMSIEQRDVVASLAQPPVAKAAQILWYQSKALELMAHFLFAPKDPEFFCMRQKRVARERVERAKELLARDLANPPTLETLGQEVGCSPFYLSRIFSREVGLTIPQYLRNLRMERGAELLRTGRYNVTEAATEVGYSSLSHFSKAFCETIGCCPVLYPAAKKVILDR